MGIARETKIIDARRSRVLNEIGPKELHALLGEPDPPLLLDVRTADERAVARIEPSLHIGLDEFLARVPQEVPRDADVVVYCHVGGRSAQAVMWMAANGWENARNLAGGIDAWSVEVDPEVPRY
jgi:rhodanese-related sulfurtransferase